MYGIRYVKGASGEIIHTEYLIISFSLSADMTTKPELLAWTKSIMG